MKPIPKYNAYEIDGSTIFYDDVFNCRGQFTLESVKALSESIASRGLDIPVIIQPAADVAGIPAGYDWRLVAGHRRFIAVTKWLRWETVPAVIREGMSASEAALLNFVENLERRDLNPLQEALAIRANFPHNPPITEIASTLKRDYYWVYRRASILKMPDEVQQMVAAKRLTLLDIQTISQQPESKWLAVAEEIAAGKRGRGVKSTSLITRSFKRRKNKSEIGQMMAHMIASGLSPTHLAVRFGAWCAGKLTDKEILADITKVEK